MRLPSWIGDGVKPHITFVRGPIVASLGAINNESVPSISLAYLSATIATEGYDFSWVDAIADGMGRYWPLERFPGYQCQGLTFAEIVDAIPAHSRVIGINAMFSGEWPITRELINEIRKHFPDALIIAGGEHATALTEFSLRECPAIDLCVRGEGEQVLVNLMELLTNGGDITQVAGIAYIDDTGAYVESSGVTRIRDIERLPRPYWPDGYLERFWAAGMSAGVTVGRDMPMMLSRGCPYRCAFCSSASMWTTRYVLRDIDAVIDEIKSYIERWNIESIQLYDLTAITKKRWAIEFCERLLSENIKLKWSVPQGTRSETLDAETLSLLKQTGCHYLVYAPESGSQRILDALHKKITLQSLVDSMVEAKRQGIVLRCNLILGFPNETRLDVLKTIWFGLRMAVKGIDDISINIYSPYPGSELFNGLMDRKRVTLSDEYFLALTSLNSDFASLNPLTINDTMGKRELALYRLGAMLACYALTYIIYPSRIVRTIRNWRDGKVAATVFEHRIRDFLKRRFLGHERR